MRSSRTAPPSATTTSFSSTFAYRPIIVCCSAAAPARRVRRPHSSPTTSTRMVAVFPQIADAKIEYAWGGFVDITRKRAPDFGYIDPNYFYVQGFSGHGVALTVIAGRIVAKAIAGDTAALDLFARLRHARFPGGPALRGPALELGMLYHRIRELF
nr:FAD-binding oxidoreductase [Paraburkholderia sp. LEh10]